MSLDVYLNGETTDVPCRCPHCDNEHTRKESECFYDENITHNLTGMASEAGIYQHLWRPEEIEITHARQLIEPLQAAIDMLRKEPDRFKKFNPANGWGNYQGFLHFVTAYLAACKQYPDATIQVSR